ncbi:MAG: DUF4202 family protein [Planctomycetes bacterium]|nr:DUF4202 family protein [Planctomycetota bacterium]
MNSIDRVRKSIEAIISGSSVPEDPVHSKNTLNWLLKLKPDADEALQIAALGHDIERAIDQRKVRREDFEHYDEFKAAHAHNSAEILKEVMLDCGVDETLIEQVYELVRRHEVGGDDRSDLLKDADSISYFEVNLPHYYNRHGWDETKRRCLWGYKRLSDKTKILAAKLTFENDELRALMRITIEQGQQTRSS